MAQTHYLSQRENWQAQANSEGAANEREIEDLFKAYFATIEGKGFEYISKPKQLEQCFLEYQYTLDPSKYTKPSEPTKGQIYYDEPTKRFRKWTGKSWTDAKEGMIPDGEIRCIATGRSILVEDKKQNDAGNAQERACKYGMPKVRAFIHNKLGLPSTQEPVVWIFSGTIADKDKYKHEIDFCFPEGYTLMLSPTVNKNELLIGWFNRVLRKLLV